MLMDTSSFFRVVDACCSFSFIPCCSSCFEIAFAGVTFAGASCVVVDFVRDPSRFDVGFVTLVLARVGREYDFVLVVALVCACGGVASERESDGLGLVSEVLILGAMLGDFGLGTRALFSGWHGVEGLGVFDGVIVLYMDGRGVVEVETLNRGRVLVLDVGPF